MGLQYVITVDQHIQEHSVSSVPMDTTEMKRLNMMRAHTHTHTQTYTHTHIHTHSIRKKDTKIWTYVL